MATLMIKRNLKEVPAKFATNFTYTGESILDVESGQPQIKFLTSGKLTPKEDIYVDVFLVGGGGAGGANSYDIGAIGGGGGYTTTEKNVILKSGETYNIVVGAGDSSKAFGTIPSNAHRGGTSSAFGFDAIGGKSGTANGSGGSGGGGRGIGENGWGGDGGSDGSDGTSGYNSDEDRITPPQSGQGKTTRAFADKKGALFSGGGAGAGAVGTGEAGKGGGGGVVYDGVAGYFVYDGQPNTGGGGCGVVFEHIRNVSGAGGSGIVIIRKAAV